MNVLQIARNGEPIGTIEFTDLQAHLSAATLLPSDHWWYEEISEWRLVSELAADLAQSRKLVVIPRSAQVVKLEREPHAARAEDNPNEILWVGSPYKPLIGKILLTILYCITIIGVIGVPGIWMRRTTYIVTRRRLLAQFGILRKTSTEVRIADVRNISLLGKSLLFGTATLTFDVAGSNGAEIAFCNILQPETVRDLVRSLQD